MAQTDQSNLAQPGATYRLVVHSAQEAVDTIRRELGPTARVLSVRNLPNSGLKSLFSRPQIEVVAELPEDEEASDPTAETLADVAENAANQATTHSVAGAYGAEAPSGRRPAVGLESEDFYAGPDRKTGRLLPDVLRRGGFSDIMMARLQGSPRWRDIEQRPLHEALSAIGSELRNVVTTPQQKVLTDRVAFLGLAGTGRTTALSKWLAHQVFQNGRTGSVAKVEFDRPNPADGLAVFCEALGINLQHVDGTAPLRDRNANEDFLVADLPSLRLGRQQDEHLADFLDQSGFTSRVLVLHALHDRAALQAAYSVGRELGATHVVFTHVDELAHWGKLWDYLLEGAVTPLFLGTGPSLVGELETEAMDALLRRTIPGA